MSVAKYKLHLQKLAEIHLAHADKGEAIKQSWEAFLKNGLPPDLPQPVSDSMQHSFYVGAMQSFSAIMSILTADESDEVETARLESLVNEFNAFLAKPPSVIAGIRRTH